MYTPLLAVRDDVDKELDSLPLPIFMHPAVEAYARRYEQTFGSPPIGAHLIPALGVTILLPPQED